MDRQTHEMLSRLESLGISRDDAFALRRIAMTLHRWFELECGDGNNHGSWAIVRGAWKMPDGVFVKEFMHDDDGKPFLEHHHYLHGKGKDYVTYSLLADRENGARKRLAKIMANYPKFVAYVQTDPRGASLYILDRTTTPEPIEKHYSRGVAVYK